MSLPPLPFAIVPVEVVRDHRLSLMQTRVLIAVLSIRNRNTNVAWAKRETISERCGYGPNVISRVTTQLVQLGWLRKTGEGGRSRPNQYEVTVPRGVCGDSETVTEAETVTDSETVTESDRKPLPDLTRNGYRIGKGHNTDHLQTQVQKNTRAREKRFVPPTLDEVRTYCREKGYAVDPEQWMDHYTANGWMVGKNRMRDWQAAVRTWGRREVENKGTARRRSGAEILAEACADAFAPNPTGAVDLPSGDYWNT